MELEVVAGGHDGLLVGCSIDLLEEPEHQVLWGGGGGDDAITVSSFLGAQKEVSRACTCWDHPLHGQWGALPCLRGQ